MRFLFSLLSLLGLLAVVQATTTTTTGAFPAGYPNALLITDNTGWGATTPQWTFNQFNPSLGTLTGVKVSITQAFSSSVIVTDTGSGSTGGIFLSLGISIADGSCQIIETDVDDTVRLQQSTIVVASSTIPTSSAFTTAVQGFTLGSGGSTTLNFFDPNSGAGSGSTHSVLSNVDLYNSGSGAGDASFAACVTGTGTWTVDIAAVVGNYFSGGGSGNAGMQVTTLAGAGAVVTYTYTAASGSGDPQIVGFNGQKFQVHGIPDEYFNLISTHTYFVNSHFVYIATGTCNYNDTECFSHPGTYMDDIAVVEGDNRVRFVAGSHAAGMKVYVNDKLIKVGDNIRISNSTFLRTISHGRALIVLPDVILTIANSDLFFNVGADLTIENIAQAGQAKVVIDSMNASKADKLISRTYPEFHMHGLLGQTWRNIEWPHAKLYQGEPTDYQTQGLYGADFLYSEYQGTPARK